MKGGKDLWNHIRQAVTREQGKLSRLAVGCLGAAALIVGLVAAWRSESATAAVVAGAALIALALLGDSVTKIGGKVGGVEGWLERNQAVDALVGLEVGLASAVAASTASDTDPEARLDALRNEVIHGAATARDEAERLRTSAYEGWASDLPWALQEGYAGYPKPEAGLMYLAQSDDGRHQRRINVVLRWWGGWRLFLRVTAPSGEVATTLIYGRRYMGGLNFTTMYPLDFDDAPPISEGDYKFEWIRAHPPVGEEDVPDNTLNTQIFTVTPEMYAQPPTT